MSSNPHNPNRTQSIPFNTPPMDDQPIPGHSSINNFPSTSQFNYPLPQHQSAASINYNEEPNPLSQLPSEREINQEQQVEELQKISLQKNLIDQDEILRMFREQENKMEKNKRSNDKRKTHQTNQSQHHQKDRKSTSHHHSNKKQPTSTQDLISHRRRQQAQQQTIPFITKTSSFKDLKPQPQSSSLYSTISNSQAIRELLLQYKIQYRSSVYDPDWQKERYKLKETFFEQLCIGIEEMRHKSESELTKDESEVLEKVKEISSQVVKMPYDFGTFKYCRNLVLEIDLELFMHFHQKSKQPLSKDYKAQYKILLTNLKDSQNYELRRKILTRQMDADMIKVANEFELFTQSKRNEIKSKEQKLLKQFSVDHERTMMKSEFQNEKEQQRIFESISYGSGSVAPQQNNSLQRQNQSQQKPNESMQSQERQQVTQNQSFSFSNILAVNKYLDESTLSQLEELLSESQVERMRNRLDEDLKGQCRQRILKRFDSLIIGKI